MTPLRFSLAFLCLLFTVSLAPARMAETPVCLAKGADAEPSPQLQDALNKLKELEIIDDPNYWMEFARKGRYCEGGRVADLIMAGANKIGKADNMEEAIRVLMESKVLQNTGGGEYWQKKAVEGAKCPGSFVEGMILQMAAAL